MRLTLFAALVLTTLPALSQPRMGLGEHPTLNDAVHETHYIHLALGNRYEYRISHSEDGETVEPAFLRFTVTNSFQPVAGAEDFMVQVDIFGAEEKLRQTNCYMRLQRGRIHLIGASVMGMPDCNYQSPFSQQDTARDAVPASVMVGGEPVEAPSTASYEHFWGDQNGDKGYISFRFAEGIGLYRFESQTNDSPLDPDPKRVSWIGELQYARVDGREFGVSMVAERFGPDAPVPSNSLAQ
jgi:hypothetical protein